jgi:hypothetical protein
MIRNVKMTSSKREHKPRIDCSEGNTNDLTVKTQHEAEGGSHSLTARSTMVSKTGCASLGEADHLKGFLKLPSVEEAASWPTSIPILPSASWFIVRRSLG